VRGITGRLKAVRVDRGRVLAMIAAMDTIFDRRWTTETFLAWEDRQEFKYEFDGQRVIPITGGSITHQRIVANVWLALMMTNSSAGSST
jgi:hypothetical protein